MTSQKKLKQAIRARAKKTGESYTAARRRILQARAKRAQPAVPPPTPATKPRSPISDASVVARTGRDLAHWFTVLDAFDARRMGHTAAAKHLHERHGVPGWHAQGITVAYERARGLRAVNQRLDGRFEISVSKVVAAPMERVADVLARPAERAAWLRGCDPAIQKALRDALSGERPRTVTVRAGKDAYIRFRMDRMTIEIRAIAKAGGRASVVATVLKIPTAETKEAQRAAWRRALEALKSHLG